MHIRKQIREKIYQLLEPHPALVNLFEARTKPLSNRKLPFANVINGAETAEDLSDQWQELRTVMFMVQVYVQDGHDVVDRLDELAAPIEALLAVDQRLGGLTVAFRYKGSDPDYTGAASSEAAMLTMNYEAKYIWEPQPVADDLTVVSVEIDMSSPRNDPPLPATPDGQIDASARITLPQ
ncbi:MAG: hypothetical protein GY734_08260 [Herbaspirillum sp.]|uniref:hypothetical protein n=1 Tax=Herbaspirillum sp. TaxID=1890675 RepID=UPI00258B7534|nr:hypothetical protein [Herbaspirillum sp.]MCP3653329.1 hypothetical protein [Herbaspirillum sp.]MCP3946742.1 hypothetical protein [Herbaspirillum sp.]MCP4031218.1 hypothetical protein [Herbaspirillum sp.]MCP4554363.1 hypothetical protein [Herbaspirillum sp.]